MCSQARVGSSVTTLCKLSTFPNYDSAAAIDVIDAYGISRKDFARRYVNMNRPCLIKRAVEHWPAFSKWANPDYLRTASTNQDVTVRSSAVSEVIGWSGTKIRDDLRQHAAASYHPMPFHDFLTALETDEDTLVADSCRFSEGSPIQMMKTDVGGLPFMPVLPRSRRYPPHRVFLYKNSYTDWHFHSTDETFMTQVLGKKEILLLPPDEATWVRLRPLIEEKGYLFDIDLDAFPSARDLRPIRATVEPGDAMYIPVFWWHAVESIGQGVGATVAATFRTPLHINGDIRFPVARKLARTHIMSRNAPLVIGMVAYSTVYRLARRMSFSGSPSFTILP